MKALITLALCVLLQACGGAQSQSVSDAVTAAPANTAPPTGGAGDGYSKGVQSIRDVGFAAGGAHGNVNTSTFARTLSGAYELAFEWVNLSILDNQSRAGENVAVYAQANKLSTGPTWASVSEATDTTGLAGALVAAEFDTFVTGPDNGLRMGLEIVSGDARAVRGMGRSVQADSTSAIRIGQTLTTPWATWGAGIDLTGNFRDSAIKVTAPNGQVVFEIKPNGDIYRRGVLLP